LQAYGAVVGTLLAAAAKAELTGALADQLQTALDSRGLIERAKGALMERERLDDQEAFTHLRRAARSSGRKLTEVAREVAAGKPLPRGRTRPARATPEQPNGEADTPQPDSCDGFGGRTGAARLGIRFLSMRIDHPDDHPDDPSDRSGAVQADAEHPSRKRKGVGSNPTWLYNRRSEHM
jgi:hypothetical protein